MNEINHKHTDTGLMLYFTVEHSSGTIWNGSALVAMAVADWTTYDIPLSETPAGGYRYVGTMPAVVAGTYAIRVYEQAGATSAITDILVAEGQMEWDGSTEITNLVLQENQLRILGLILHNHVEDDIVRDANGLKISATIYLYDSAAHATIHDKVTGVIGKYTVTPQFTSQLMTLLKSVQVI